MDKNFEKTYELDELTAEQMVEDFLASEEEENEEELLSQGWEYCGSWDKDTTEEEMEKDIEKLVSDME